VDSMPFCGAAEKASPGKPTGALREVWARRSGQYKGDGLTTPRLSQGLFSNDFKSGATRFPPRPLQGSMNNLKIIENS